MVYDKGYLQNRLNTPVIVINNKLIVANKNVALLYLQKYAEKDLGTIKSLFAEDIILRDWKIRVLGIANSIEQTQNNFEAAATLKIEILSLYENENTVAAELKIIVDNQEELYVVDMIEINDQGKISSIRAFLGRGDVDI